MNNKLFEEKAKEYKVKPKPNIKACKYEEGMENGWAVEYYNEYGDYIEIFETKNKAYNFYNSKKPQLVKVFSNGNTIEEYVETFYYEPFPCFWDCITRIKEYDRICKDDWIIDKGNGNYETISEGLLFSKYELI